MKIKGLNLKVLKVAKKPKFCIRCGKPLVVKADTFSGFDALTGKKKIFKFKTKGCVTNHLTGKLL